MSKDTQTEEKKSKKGFFQKLGSLVYEDAPEVKEEASSEAATNNTSNQSPSKFSYSEAQANPNPGIVIPNANGVFDQKFYESFLHIIEANNMDGIDYCEFSRAKRANDSIPGMTDSVKFQSAFASLKATYTSLTKERLLETADFYITKLNEEEKNFGAEMQHEIENQVTARITSAKNKQDEIQSKQEEIVRLQTEMNTLQGEIGTLNAEAQQMQVKIDSTAKNFKVSLEVLKSQIAQDKQSITNFIQ